jgi:hypothetical protein
VDDYRTLALELTSIWANAAGRSTAPGQPQRPARLRERSPRVPGVPTELQRKDEAEGGEPTPSPTRVPRSRRTRTAGPLYLEFDRKETRLCVDQLRELTEHARRLNRAKSAGGPRITENTLIRIAVHLLLADIDRADGSTEERIRRSLEY